MRWIQVKYLGPALSRNKFLCSPTVFNGSKSGKSCMQIFIHQEAYCEHIFVIELLAEPNKFGLHLLECLHQLNEGLVVSQLLS